MGEDDNGEWTLERVEKAADELAHKLGASDRNEAFRKLSEGAYDGQDAEMTLSAFRHILSDVA